MKLLMMFCLLHTIIIILAAPAGSNTALRALITGSPVITTQGTFPDPSSTGSNCNVMSLSSKSGSTASVHVTPVGSVTNITAPTGTLLTAPTSNDESYDTCTFGTNMDEAYMIGIILAASFSGIALIIASVLICSVAICVKRIQTLDKQERQLLAQILPCLTSRAHLEYQ
ncbi:hypothetical protein BDR04DRAFT_1093145 [Suillus decipiens]|nr:hypothetical protein BDR04DRAFT_1093145 [Suillus decipiens]